jgi:hypothetical protein
VSERSVARIHPVLPVSATSTPNQPLVCWVMRKRVPRLTRATGRARVPAAGRTLALAGTTYIQTSALSPGSEGARVPEAGGSPASASGELPSRSTRPSIQASRMNRYPLTEARGAAAAPQVLLQAQVGVAPVRMASP